ncbi:MAG: DNA integrity scanning protein DisA [Thermoleophilia bacterium]|nr:DNA integrity scanning protein DisA [Thermoleophilia bacterium]MDQ3859591.1 DNA integrity scanning diadenylate cyclase DisA [Actinomycetota bacterium]
MRADPRKDKTLLSALSQVAPGTALRTGIDDVIRSEHGALIVVGEPSDLAFLFSGGMRLDLPLTPQLLYELAKMDGAIILNADLSRIVYANLQLMPDPTIASAETGTRHRTAERVAKQTGALVISISQQRETVTLFIGDLRYQLGEISDVLARTNQALATLETYRTRLDQGLTRLTALEFQGAVTLDDVLVVLQRAEMTTRMAEEIERNCVELGEEGRLIRMQLDELMEDVPREKAAVVYDYELSGEPGSAASVLERLAALPYERLVEFEEIAVLLGYPREANPLDYTVVPRGHRVLSHIPRLPESVIRQVVRDFESLDAVIRASQRDLEAVDGVGVVRAREIREGLRRLQEHNLVDRYLQL